MLAYLIGPPGPGLGARVESKDSQSKTGLEMKPSAAAAVVESEETGSGETEATTENTSTEKKKGAQESGLRREMEAGTTAVEVQAQKATMMRGLTRTEVEAWCADRDVNEERREMITTLQEEAERNGLDSRMHVAVATNPHIPLQMPETQKEQTALAETILKENVVMWTTVHKTTIGQLVKEAEFKGIVSQEWNEYILQVQEARDANNEYAKQRSRQEAVRKGLMMVKECVEEDTDDEEGELETDGTFSCVENMERFYQTSIENEACAGEEDQGTPEPDLIEPEEIRKGSTWTEIREHLVYGVQKCRQDRGMTQGPTPEMQRYT